MFFDIHPIEVILLAKKKSKWEIRLFDDTHLCDIRKTFVKQKKLLNLLKILKDVRKKSKKTNSVVGAKNDSSGAMDNNSLNHFFSAESV